MAIFSLIKKDFLKKNKNYHSLYGEIPNRSLAFTDRELSQIVWYKRDSFSLPPVMDFVFILDEIHSHNDIKPLEYLGYLIRYKGRDSLLYNLKKNNLASNIDCGNIGSFKHFSQFAISVTLTNRGTKEFQNVIETVFTYIEHMKANIKDTINENIYMDISNIFSKDFNFWQKNEKLKLSEYLNTLSINMFDYKAKSFVSNDNLMTKFDSEILTKFIKNISQANSLVIIGTYKMNGNLKNFFGKTPIVKEKYFKTEYSRIEFPKDFNKKIEGNLIKKNNSFALRRINKYITSLNELVTCVEPKKKFEGQLGNFIKLDEKEEKKINCANERNKIEPTLIYSKNNINFWYKVNKNKIFFLLFYFLFLA